MDILGQGANPTIHRLPPEVLVQILLLSDKQTIGNWYPHFRLSWVCRHWREVVVSSRAFWTVIRFSPWKGRDFIRELVSRSGSAGLTVIASYDHKHGEETLRTFNELLDREGYRIKSLLITEHWRHTHLLLGKVLPFIHYLDISLFSFSLTLELQPSFIRLEGLNARLGSALVANQLFTCLSLCPNLKSLTIGRIYPRWTTWNASHLTPSIIKLPNLTFLNLDYHPFADRLCAPALRCLLISSSPEREISQSTHPILDEYDLSTITHLSIRAYDIFADTKSELQIRGSEKFKLISGQRPMIPFTVYDFTVDDDHELRENMLPSISSSETTHFSFFVPTGNKSLGSFLGPKSSFLPKLLLKLRNLEALSIDPYHVCNWENIHGLARQKSALKLLKILLKEIFNNLIGVKLRWLIITVVQPIRLDYLRTILSMINDCSLLSNLNTFTLRISVDSADHTDYSINGRDFGEELVNFLRIRRKADYDAVRKINVEGGHCLLEKWIAEAAALGTQMQQSSFSLDDQTDRNFWGH